MSHLISPTADEFREARRIVSDALDLAASAFPMERDVVVELRWGGEPWVVDEVDGASGFARYPNRIEIEFDTNAERWQTSLRSTTVHEHAHVWGYEERGRESDTKWEYVLEEAFTQHVAKRLVPEYQSPWWTKHGRDVVANYWPDVVGDLDDESEDGGPMFIDPTEGGYPHGFGYSLAYQLGQELIDDVDLSEIPTLPKQTLVDAGSRVYEDD